MANELNGKTIAFLMANSGVEQVELTTPWETVKEAGGHPVLVAPEDGQVRAFNHDVEPGDSFRVDKPVSQVSPSNFEGLILPGGTTNPDQLRLHEPSMDLVRGFVEVGKPIAAICHGPWSLVEANVLKGKTLTSWPSLRTDIRNAGGTWADEEVYVCDAQGWTLVTSRKPDDLEAFCNAAIQAFTNAEMRIG